MKFIRNILKSFIFGESSIRDLSETSFLYYLIILGISNLLSLNIRIFYIGIESYITFIKTLIVNVLYLIIQILSLFLLLKRDNKRKTIKTIIQACILTNVIFSISILFYNNSVTYKIINGIINIYCLYYIFMFLFINQIECNKKKLEVCVILSAIIAKVLSLGLLIIYNSFFEVPPYI